MDTSAPPPAFAALADVGAHDPGLLDDAPRLRAALLDLVDDESGIGHVVAAVRLGVPGCIADGRINAATGLLVDEGGIRPELASALVDAWGRAIRSSRGEGAAVESRFRAIAVASSPATVTPAGATACHVWPDGAVTVAVMDLAGVVVATVDTPTSATARADWRVIAPVEAPVSRAVVLGRGPHGAVLCWTDRTGVWKRPIRRDPLAGVVELGETGAVDQPSTGQPRYPMAASPTDGTDPDLFWTLDRRSLLASTYDVLGQVTTSPLPAPCEGTERLTALECAAVGNTTSWLMAQTDRNRLLLARWDVAARDHDGWRPIALPPFPGPAVAAVALGSGSLLAAGIRGGFAVFDVAAGYAGAGWWREFEVPGPIDGTQTLASATNGQATWCVATSASEIRLLRLLATTEGLVCPNVVTLVR